MVLVCLSRDQAWCWRYSPQGLGLTELEKKLRRNFSGQFKRYSRFFASVN
jgi:hypothetical protein